MGIIPVLKKNGKLWIIDVTVTLEIPLLKYFLDLLIIIYNMSKIVKNMVFSGLSEYLCHSQLLLVHKGTCK